MFSFPFRITSSFQLSVQVNVVQQWELLHKSLELLEPPSGEHKNYVQVTRLTITTRLKVRTQLLLRPRKSLW